MGKWFAGGALIVLAGLAVVWGLGGTEANTRSPAPGVTPEEVGRVTQTESVGGWPSGMPNDEAMVSVDTQIEKLAEVLPGPDEPVRRIVLDRGEQSGVVADLAGAGKIPESFPSAVPIYPGARSAGALSVGGEGAAAAFVAEAPLATVFRYYHEALVDSGWTIDEAAMAALPAGNQPDRLIAQKDGHQIWVTIMSVSGGSQIFVAMQE